MADTVHLDACILTRWDKEAEPSVVRGHPPLLSCEERAESVKATGVKGTAWVHMTVTP